MKLSILLAALLGSPALAAVLPVEIIPHPLGRISAVAEAGGSHLRVSGTVRVSQPGLLHTGSHVDVDILDRNERILATAVDKIGRPSRHPKSAAFDRETFMATFPMKEMDRAATVRVVFHNHAHTTCPMPNRT